MPHVPPCGRSARGATTLHGIAAVMVAVVVNGAVIAMASADRITMAIGTAIQCLRHAILRRSGPSVAG